MIYKNYRPPKTLRATLIASTALAFWSNAAMAEDTDIPHYHSAGNQPGAMSSSFGETLQEGPTGGIWQQDQLLGSMGGIRPWLGSYGISLGITETSEILGNTSGGVKRGADYDGLTL